MPPELQQVSEDANGSLPMDPNIDPAPQAIDKPEPAAGAEKPLSRRESIAKALEDKQAKNAEIAAAPAPAEGRARDPASGRFINKDGTLAAPDAGAAAAAATPQSQALPSRKPMPKAWKQDYAPKWDAMDPDLANHVAELEAKREQDVLAGVEKYRGLAQYAEGLRNVIAPREQQLAQQYGSAANGIKTLFDISDAASQNPQGFIRWFAQQRGIDLRSLVPVQQGQYQDPNAPQGQQMPDLTPYIQQAIQPFAQRQQVVEQQLQQYQNERQQAETSQREQAVNSFFTEADTAGTLKFPLDDGAMDDFAKRVKFLRGENPDWDYRRVLEKSYEDLTWTSESLRAKRLEADAKRQATEAKERQTREIAAKKSAAVSVKGAPGTSPAASIDPSNRRAVIERAVANLQR